MSPFRFPPKQFTQWCAAAFLCAALTGVHAQTKKAAIPSSKIHLNGTPQKTKAKTAGSAPKSTNFSDVPPGHWAAQAVQDLKSAGIVVGYPSGRF